MLIKQKSPLLPRNLTLVTFGELPIVFLTRINLLYLVPEVLSSASDKAKLFAENFSENSSLILMSQAFLHLFSLLELI